MKFVGRRRSAKPFRTWLKNLCFYKSGSFEYLLACLFVCFGIFYAGRGYLLKFLGLSKTLVHAVLKWILKTLTKDSDGTDQVGNNSLLSYWGECINGKYVIITY